MLVPPPGRPSALQNGDRCGWATGGLLHIKHRGPWAMRIHADTRDDKVHTAMIMCAEAAAARPSRQQGLWGHLGGGSRVGGEKHSSRRLCGRQGQPLPDPPD